MPSFDVQGALSAGYTPTQIADEMGAGAGFDTAGARQAGYSDQQIIDQISGGRPQQATATAPQPAANPLQTDTSYSGALGYGVHQLGQELGQTGQFLGHETGWKGLEDAGQSLENYSAQPNSNYQPTNIGGSLSQGDYLGAIKQLPRAAVEAAAPLAGQLAGGALSSAVGAGPIPGVALASGAETLGHDVYGAAQRNGEGTNPGAASIAEGVGTTAAKAALSAVGIRAPGVAELAFIPRVAAQVGTDAAAGAGVNAVDQLNQSGSIDPYQAAGAGLQAGTARLSSLAPMAAREGIQTASDQALSRIGPQPVSQEHAASILRVGQLMDDATKAAADTTGKVPETTAANNVKSQLFSSTTGAISDLAKIGVLSSDAASAAGRIVTDRALRNNNTFTENDAIELQAALAGAPPEAVQGILQDTRDLNTVSTQSFQRNATGPLQQLGSTIGRVAVPALELYHGNVLGAAGAALFGHPTAALGGKVGQLGDNLLGLSRPPVAYQRIAAARMMAGQDVGIPMQSAGIRQAVNDVQSAQAAAAQRSGQTDAAYQQRDLQNNPPPAPVSPGMVAQGAVNDATAAQARGQTDAYLSGKMAPPADATAPLGSQTAAEIAQWQQQLANARARVKVSAAQQGVLNQASAGTIENQGQARLDAQTRAAAVKLQAAQQLPTPRPDVPDMAQRAGVSQAMQDAARTLATARRLPAQSADRMEVGQPPTMGHPDGSPVMPDGTPLRPQWGTRAAVQAPETAPGTGTQTGSEQVTEGQPLPPPPAYLANHLMATQGVSLTPDLYEQALDSAIGAGHLTPQQGAFWRSYRGEMTPAVRDVLAAHVVGSSAGQRSQVGLPPDPTVSRPLAYLASARAHHADLTAAAAELDQVGIPDGAALVRHVRDSNNQTPETDKATVFETGLAKLPPEVQAKVRSRVTATQLTHAKRQ